MKQYSNQEVATLFREISVYLDMQGIAFKPRAYEKVSEIVQSREESLCETWKQGGIKALLEIPGIGASIADHLNELFNTGKLKYYIELQKKTPVKLGELLAIEGLGPKSIKKLYTELHIKTRKDLERAAKSGKIRRIAGFGEKTEENILKGIGFAEASGGRMFIARAMPTIRSFEKRLKAVSGVERITIAGSVRRQKETIGDIDILVVANDPDPIMETFVKFPEVQRVYARGITKSSVRISLGLDVDLRVVPKNSHGAALNYFTGSKDHNVALRRIAIAKGYKLNEYGLYKGVSQRKSKRGLTPKEIQIAGKTEEEIYKKLGLDYIEPEMRENTGEIMLAQKHKLPKLVEYGDIRGDLQVQTDWTDGADSIEAMARAAIALGFEYIAITDHTKRLAMTHGLDEKRIRQQWKEIDRVNKKLGGEIKILKGTECDILKDGTLDLPDSILSKLDIVGVSVHSYFNLSRKDQTERIIRAIRNPHVDILFHPTGRVVNRREPYDVDIDAIIAVAKETDTVLEIDANERLDLKDEHIKKCVEAGVKMVIDSDAHSSSQFACLEYGIAQARRGWAEKKDIVNAWPLEKMRKMLK